MTKRVLVTGAGGLIGSEAARFYLEKGCEVDGIDNNMRRYFFGEKGDTTGNIAHLSQNPRFRNHAFDLRDERSIMDFMRENRPYDMIVHTAAQPSHDWAAKEPLTDFDINARATLIMLEAFRQYSPEAVFIHMSTNKVYGDTPNKAILTEGEKRYDFGQGQEHMGITSEGVNERMSLDDSTHSVFGAGKVAGDVYAQEYGRYFGLNVGVFRGGCLTGPQHSAVPLHGFLTYIVDCAVNGTPYTILGYKGKQVRDQIHSFDVVNAFDEFARNPRKGEAYNIGGTRQNAASVLEVIDILEEFGHRLDYTYKEQNRVGDHIVYYSDMSKFREHYPNWRITKSLRDIISEIIQAKKK